MANKNRVQIMHFLVSTIIIVTIISTSSANPTSKIIEDTTPLTSVPELVQNIETTEMVYDSTGITEDNSEKLVRTVSNNEIELKNKSEIETTTPQSSLIVDDDIENATESETRESKDHHVVYDEEDEELEEHINLTPTGPLTTEQQEVIKELNDIWNYSSSLNDTDKDLKTTLSSVVKLAYARLKIEKDETLHRLKYLLKKLRQRIGLESDVDDAELEQTDEQQTTSLPYTVQNNSEIESSTKIPISTSKNEPFSTSTITTTIKSRRKRAFGLGTGIGEYEAVKVTDEDSLYSNYLNYIHNNENDHQNSYEHEEQQVIPTATPSEKTIQKIILVQDMMTSSPLTLVTNDKLSKTPLDLSLSTVEPSLSTTIFLPPLKLPVQSLPVNSPSTKNPVSSQNTSTDDREPVSVEQIASAIVKLLYPTLQQQNNNNNQKNPNSVIENPSTGEYTFPLDRDKFLNKLSLLNGINDHHKQQDGVLQNPGGHPLNMYHLTTTKPNLFPAYLQVHPLPLFLSTTSPTQNYPPILQQLLANQMHQSAITMTVDSLKVTTPTPNLTVEEQEDAETNQLMQDNDLNDHTNFEKENDTMTEKSTTTTIGLKLDSSLDGPTTTIKTVEAQTIGTTMTSTTTTTATTPAPVQVMQIIEELTDSNLLAGPSAFLNGTRDGLVQFIATLSTLSFTTKMVMVFALSISALSIILGVYSLGPPIIAVGILGILIPIAILLLLQDSSKNRNQNVPQGKIMEELKNEMFIVLDLIENAFEKYE